jgi:hypothetical protein
MQGVTETRLRHPEASGNEVFDVFDAMYVPAALEYFSHSRREKVNWTSDWLQEGGEDVSNADQPNKK